MTGIWNQWDPSGLYSGDSHVAVLPPPARTHSAAFRTRRAEDRSDGTARAQSREPVRKGCTLTAHHMSGPVLGVEGTCAQDGHSPHSRGKTTATPISESCQAGLSGEPRTEEVPCLLWATCGKVAPTFRPPAPRSVLAASWSFSCKGFCRSFCFLTTCCSLSPLRPLRSLPSLPEPPCPH